MSDENNKETTDELAKVLPIDIVHEMKKSFIDYFVWNYFVGYQRLENIEYELKKLKKEFNNIFYRILLFLFYYLHYF